MRWIVFAVLAAASFSAVAGTIDVNLSNDTIEARYDSAAGAADWTFGALYNRDDKNYAFNVGLLAAGDAGAGGSRIEGGVGGKIYTVRVADSDVAALALGGQVRWFPNNGSFAVGGYAFYAPKVVTFMDGKNFYDTGIRGEVEVIKNSSVYIGYRWTRAELDNGTSPYVDKGGFAGLQVKF
ncbi:MAG TPA: YfaZ family outer membrane protein [Burkholderiales bacterium]|nr:YfaZ family outer membrane protein [Burkholderiales bacterium]